VAVSRAPDDSDGLDDGLAAVACHESLEARCALRQVELLHNFPDVGGERFRELAQGGLARGPL